MILHSFLERDTYCNNPCSVAKVHANIALNRARSLQLFAKDHTELFPTHCTSGGGVSSLAIDTYTDDRFLLAGKGNGEILLHDLEIPADRSIVARCDRKSAQHGAHKVVL